MGAIDPLHREPERRASSIFLDLDPLEILEKMRTSMPRGAGAQRTNVVAVTGGDWRGHQRTEAKRLRKLPIVGLDPPKDRLVETGEVDLVDRQHHVAHPEQRSDDRMAVGLGQQTLARVDKHDRQIGIGGAGRHVAGILLVARRIRDDEGPPVGGEIAVSDVDRDALLALGFEPVDEQGEIDVVLDRSELPGVALQRRELVVVDQLLLEQQSPDERGLAVVDRTAGQ